MNSQICNELEQLGVRNGDSLLIHSAFSSLKRQVSPKEFIDSLRNVVGSSGTIILPTLSWANVTRSEPIFDIAKTPCCTGFLPEYFRTSYEGVIRSLHPTHSCAAAGHEAKWFVGEHHLDDTPVGSHSPFRKLREAKGKILFLGCGTEPNTSMHGVEELVNPPYLYGDKLTYTMTDYDGKAYYKTYTPHGFEGTDQNYDRLEALMPEGTIYHGKLLSAECVLMDAEAVWSTALQYMNQNPLYFVTIHQMHQR